MLNIQQHQFQDLPLNQLRQQHPEIFPLRVIDNGPVICYKPYPNAPEGSWKIALPSALIRPVVEWYHRVLGHCRANKMYDSICTHFHAPKLHQVCKDLKCATCQCNTQLGPGYGELPPRQASLLPWTEVAVDLIGPWKMKVGNKEIEFSALTCIDPVSNIVEMIRLNNKTAVHVAQQFENAWLSRYPRLA
eukprot:15360000-Ditylum_brightwellii.AAC.1